MEEIGGRKLMEKWVRSIDGGTWRNKNDGEPPLPLPPRRHRTRVDFFPRGVGDSEPGFHGIYESSSGVYGGCACVELTVPRWV